MHRLKILIVTWFTCTAADIVEDRDFVPSASMDTEDGWRVMQGPQLDEFVSRNRELYFSFPKLERESDEINKVFLNNDEEFRIQVLEPKAADELVLFPGSDSIPVASSLISKSPKPTKKEAPMKPSNVVNVNTLPPFKKHKEMKKPLLYPKNPNHSPYVPLKFTREPLLDRFPYYDMVPEHTNLRNYQSLYQLKEPILLPPFDYLNAPKYTPYRQLPMLDNSVEYYEIDKNARPIILKEEISYENAPSFPQMPPQLTIPRESIIRKPYYKGLPIPISVKTRKVLKKPKRSMRTYLGPSHRGIPIIRGHFSL